MKTKRYLWALCIAFSVFPLHAQQDLMLSQEIFSRVNKNPAATGNTDDIDFFLHGRIQWAGVENSPKSTVLNVTNYLEKINSGVGFTMSYDHQGIGHNSTNVKLVYAYQVDLSERYLLSMGLGAGVQVGGFDYTANTMVDVAEYGNDTYPYEKDVRVSPDFDLGFEFTHPSWTVGLSMTHLTNKESTTFKSGRHLYLYGIGNLHLNENWILAPVVNYFHHDKTNVCELGSLAYFKRMYWGGVSWRPDFHSKVNPSMLVFTLGVEWKKFRFGYSCDLGLGKNEQISASTHELILSYGLAKSKFRKK
ncbi:MAG: PorP/SprF family type IX secretion system membrane protein [Paludibacteraceae bacterium]|nr:PorP/SprF family type IX secretion system membrane protein [Paludibacteraceae bacterium]MBR5374721.1 PorP/SprF family type IX secretion system membrane protein [Paludibacteraceae bacterium]